MVLRIGVFGDVVGRPGREAVAAHLPGVIEKLQLDLCVLNIENAAHGFGFNGKMVEAFAAAGAQVMLTGNHAFDQADAVRVLSEHPHVIRPANYPAGTPGKGLCEFETPKGKVVVAQVMGRLFMTPLDCPFKAIDTLLAPYRLGLNCAAILVDIHGEGTSEKMAMGHHLDGRATLVEGTHTHVPTADTMILPQGTAYQTDLGMTGAYHSVIGFDAQTPLRRFITGRSGGKLSPADGDGTLSGVYVEADRTTGLATRVEPIRQGGPLAQAFPQG